MSRFWPEYVKAAYDLIVESEGRSQIYLDSQVEVYVVHLFARNFERNDIGETPIAIQILEAKRKRNYETIADECLLINSFPLRRSKWPSDSYYVELGTLSYSMAQNDVMKQNFQPASQILHTVFKRIG